MKNSLKLLAGILLVAQPAHPPGDLLGRTDLGALAVLDGADVVGRLVEVLHRAGVEKGNAVEAIVGENRRLVLQAVEELEIAADRALNG